MSRDFERNLSGLRNSLIYNEYDIYKEAAERLSTVLVPRDIPPGIKNLVLLPTGKLSIIPFESLFHKKLRKENSFDSFPYLLKKYSIRYEFAAAMILQKTKYNPGQTPSVFLCAPVSFKQSGLVQLPGTESEVNEISKLFSAKNLRNEVMTRNEADEGSVKAAGLKSFSYLHFATHGLVDEEHPDLSRVYLHASSDDEDGNLYAGEIYNLELNARLVTLSACQTGLGKILKGEGVMGLSRALVYAGSANVMVSFWKVADESTADLMKQFYGELLETSHQDLATALQQAKMKLMRTRDFASPYYWAPFVMIGF
jgi:CHAT domain-containing protein